MEPGRDTRRVSPGQDGRRDLEPRSRGVDVGACWAADATEAPTAAMGTGRPILWPVECLMCDGRANFGLGKRKAAMPTILVYLLHNAGSVSRCAPAPS